MGRKGRKTRGNAAGKGRLPENRGGTRRKERNSAKQSGKRLKTRKLRQMDEKEGEEVQDRAMRHQTEGFCPETAVKAQTGLNSGKNAV